jgi:hypothetical protein
VSTTRVPAHVSGVVPIEMMVGDDLEDARGLKLMANQAREYLLAFRWCEDVKEAYFGDGYGGIAAIFLLRIKPSQASISEWLWVVIGPQIPPAYLEIDYCKNPVQAFEIYLEGISLWVDAAKKGKSVKELIPIYVAPTPENATELERTLVFLRQTLLPQLKLSKAN